MEEGVRLFDRRFASDVVCHTTYILIIVILLSLIQTSVRFAHTMGTEPAANLISKVGDILAESLFVSWPLICTLGLCSAMAQWVSRGQDLIVAGAGLAFRRVVGPGLLLALTILAVGSATLSRLIPAEDVAKATWVEGNAWGAVLASKGYSWHWVEFQVLDGEIRVRRGRTENSSDLPDSARTALVAGGSPLIGNWHRGLFLLLASAMMLRALHLGAKRVDLFAFGIPLMGWFAWTKILRSATALLGDDLGGTLGAAALASLIFGAVGFGALRFTKK
jgi:hypothetical protein